MRLKTLSLTKQISFPQNPHEAPTAYFTSDVYEMTVRPESAGVEVRHRDRAQLIWIPFSHVLYGEVEQAPSLVAQVVSTKKPVKK